MHLAGEVPVLSAHKREDAVAESALCDQDGEMHLTAERGNSYQYPATVAAVIRQRDCLCP